MFVGIGKSTQKDEENNLSYLISKWKGTVTPAVCQLAPTFWAWEYFTICTRAGEPLGTFPTVPSSLRAGNDSLLF